MNENYIAELMARLAVPDQRSNARREAQALNDAAVLAQIEPLVQQARTSSDIQSLATILGALARNTQHPQVTTLYAQLVEKPRLTGVAIRSLIDDAPISSILAGWVRRQLDHKSATVLSAAIQYLGRTGGAEDLKAIGEFLDRDCDGRCHPMWCIFSFEENKRPEGIQYIERAIKRHAQGRTKIDQEICGYGEIALAKFVGRPVTYHGDGTVTWINPPNENKQE